MAVQTLNNVACVRTALFELFKSDFWIVPKLYELQKQKDIYFNGFSIISVKAKSFADREIRYTLKAQGHQGAGTFNIGPSTGIVKLAKELDFEDLRQPHVYQLIVTATEDSGGFSTTVEVLKRYCLLHNIIKYTQVLQ